MDSVAPPGQQTGHHAPSLAQEVYSRPGNPEKPRRLFLPRWRKMTWALLIWSVVCLVWVVGGSISGHAHNVASCAHQADAFFTQKDCQNASDAGTAIGAGLVIGLWFMGFLVLSLVWFMTRPRGQR